jgi:hypothetical protein
MTSRPVRPGSAPFRGVTKHARAKEQERSSWAGPHLVLATWDTSGVGSVVTDVINFGTIFEGQPFFAYGVEPQEDQILTAGDYPFTSCGVASWVRTPPTNDRGESFYIGASIWINVQSNNEYRLRFRFGFEGIAIRNREYIG